MRNKRKRELLTRMIKDNEWKPTAKIYKETFYIDDSTIVLSPSETAKSRRRKQSASSNGSNVTISNEEARSTFSAGKKGQRLAAPKSVSRSFKLCVCSQVAGKHYHCEVAPNLCGYVAGTRYILQYHLHKHENEDWEALQCPKHDCNYKCRVPATYAMHLASHMSSGSLLLEECSNAAQQLEDKGWHALIELLNLAYGGVDVRVLTTYELQKLKQKCIESVSSSKDCSGYRIDENDDVTVNSMQHRCSLSKPKAYKFKNKLIHMYGQELMDVSDTDAYSEEDSIGSTEVVIKLFDKHPNQQYRKDGSKDVFHQMTQLSDDIGCKRLDFNETDDHNNRAVFTTEHTYDERSNLFDEHITLLNDMTCSCDVPNVTQQPEICKSPHNKLTNETMAIFNPLTFASKDGKTGAEKSVKVGEKSIVDHDSGVESEEVLSNVDDVEKTVDLQFSEGNTMDTNCTELYNNNVTTRKGPFNVSDNIGSNSNLTEAMADNLTSVAKIATVKSTQDCNEPSNKAVESMMVSTDFNQMLHNVFITLPTNKEKDTTNENGNLKLRDRNIFSVFSNLNPNHVEEINYKYDPTCEEHQSLENKIEISESVSTNTINCLSNDELLGELINRSMTTKFHCVCGQLFLYKDTFEAHKLLHSEENPMRCGLCQKTFLSWSSFYAHVNHIHTCL